MTKERLLLPSDPEFQSAASYLITFETFDDFRSGMGNFYMHFVKSWHGDIYRGQLHYMRYVKVKKREADSLLDKMDKKIRRSVLGFIEDESLVGGLWGAYGNMRLYVDLNDPGVMHGSEVDTNFLIH